MGVNTSELHLLKLRSMEKSYSFLPHPGYCFFQELTQRYVSDTLQVFSPPFLSPTFHRFKSRSSSFIKGQPLVTSLPHILELVCGSEEPSYLPCPGVPFIQSYTYCYSFPRLGRYFAWQVELGLDNVNSFPFPAYRNELGSGRGQGKS